jgi:hypothetical protein
MTEQLPPSLDMLRKRSQPVHQRWRGPPLQSLRRFRRVVHHSNELHNSESKKPWQQAV